ncbi:elongation factor P 5-aminopentanone reductase [Paenisporosarcina sp. TG20]|uniref:elongation factor P 5-aminopentanone reductase n=1 Tax=Paenisporosarcina sp. TG20 TaxID=1211706 RepID=UPI0002F78356|nr:SDR family oxidoreductase [Paenisporosarcina sp. TG20]
MMKFACIFGASGAIGHSCAHEMSKQGWSLYLHFHENKLAIEKLYRDLTKIYPQQEFHIIQADLGNTKSVNDVLSQLFEVHAIVFASGHALYQLLEDTSSQEMNLVWRTHVQSPMWITGQLATKLRRANKSYIVFIGSIWGETGAAGESVYSSVKGAQHAFVKAFAKESGPSGIRVNAIAPGLIDTKMNDTLNDSEKQMLKDDIPLRQFGTPQDVANLVAFLTSDKADYITGQVLRVNGGWYI